MTYERYERLFINRRDAYQEQMPDGSYRCRREPVDGSVVERHLRGERTCGWYAINTLGRTKWACLDADREDGIAVLQRAHRELGARGLVSYLEESRDGRGHLWVFTQPIEPRPLSAILHKLAPEGVEVFPKQDRIGLRALGSAVRGPLGMHRRTGRRYGFLDPGSLEKVGTTLAEQLAYLNSAQVNLGTAIAEALAEMMAARGPEARTAHRPDLDVVEMAGRFTELEDRGSYFLGLCPLHPEKHHSFAVYPNPGGVGRWVCFHDNVSGDAVSLYARMKHISYQQACEELRR